MLKQLTVFPKEKLWHYAWMALALAYAVPVALRAYDHVIEVTRKAREQLILHHRLWELQPGFRGKPEQWARLAARLLTDRQLLLRVRAKYGEAAQQVELEYRSDLTIAQAEVVLAAFAIWALPVAAIYGVGWLLLKRTRAPPPPPAPPRPTYDESRYRP
jgi:hypothetical protein